MVSIPNEKFYLEHRTRENQNIFLLRGTIDEDTTFDEIAKYQGPYVFNFKEITSINSCGVRSWVNFIKSLGKQSVAYEECPPVIVRQMNMVPSFVGPANVLSVYVPYVCDGCDTEKTVLVNRSQFSGKLQIASSFPCDSCKKNEMVVDGQPDQYFAFLK